jgi:hypothetical protein
VGAVGGVVATLIATLAITAGACKRSEPGRSVTADAAVELRARPPELAYVTLKVVGMT